MSTTPVIGPGITVDLADGSHHMYSEDLAVIGADGVLRVYEVASLDGAPTEVATYSREVWTTVSEGRSQVG